MISFQARFFEGIAWIFLCPSGPIFLDEQTAVFVHLTYHKDFSIIFISMTIGGLIYAQRE